MMKPITPEKDCRLCPRLAQFRDENRLKFPEFYNGAVPSFGDINAEVLVVGLAPGLKGANFSGRPFTGDYAGDVLYTGLLAAGFASGTYGAHANDGLSLNNLRITNAVRCAPPENKPTGAEMTSCFTFLEHEIRAMPHLKAIMALGGIAHKQTLKALGATQTANPFKHQARHNIAQVTLFDSYHCSRYNINTGRLTQDMFNAVLFDIWNFLYHKA